MRYNILSICLCSILLLASCQEDNYTVADDTILRDGSIGFGTTTTETSVLRTRAVDNVHIGDSCFVSVDVEPIPDPIPQTRAALIDETTLTTMGVTGYLTIGGSFNNSATANYLINEKVSKNGTDWKYTNTKYWPSSTADKVSFFAYAPYFVPIPGGGAQTTSLDFVKKGVPTISYTAFADPDWQYDLMVGVPLMNRTKPAVNSPLQFTMKHVLSSIGFTVTGNGEKFNEINIQGIYRTGTLSMDITNGINWYGYSDLSTKITAPQAGIGRTIIASAAVQQVHTNDGYIMVVPQDVPEGAELVIELGDVEIKRIKLKSILAKWEPGKRYIYNLKFKNPDEIEIDLTDEESNCFLLNPIPNKNVTYKLPIKQVNRFWGNTTYNNHTPSNKIEETEAWQVGLLWQDKQNMVRASGENNITISKSTGNGINDYYAIRIPKGAAVKAGNFLVGVSSNGSVPSLNEISAGVTNILWSWHIWITDYNPYGTKAGAIASGSGTKTPVPSGNLYTYVDGNLGHGDRVVWGRGDYKYILDRNVGALAPTNTSQLHTDGMFTYQFGRKDPFPADVPLYDINGNPVPYTISANIYDYGSNTPVNPKPTMAWSVQHPLRFLTMLPANENSEGNTLSANDGRWCYDINGLYCNWNDKTVTDAKRKSLFDPSPQKFRMPVNGTWSGMINRYDYYNYQTGLNDPPYIYPIAYDRDPTLGQMVYDEYGEIHIWSATPLNNDDTFEAGRGSAYSLNVYYNGPNPSYEGTPAKATTRAVRSVQ